MKETIMTSAQVAYEKPCADIIEVAVERGFEVTGGGSEASAVNYNSTNWTETLGREDEDL